ncbi:MAG: CPBP family intramembrane glutamic endopeptidase [Candidatus Altiarchaeota archaeon]
MKIDTIGLLLASLAILAARYVFPGYLEYAIMCLALMAALPAAYIIASRRRLGDYLLQRGDLWGGLKVSAALILLAFPIMHYGSTLEEFQSYYPTWAPARHGIMDLFLYETYMLALMVSTEVLYRGFLMNILSQGTRYGNAIHAVIYMLAHLGKPPIEVAYSLPVGWLFGEVDKRYGSILPSLTMHYVSSLIFDLMVLYQAGAKL